MENYLPLAYQEDSVRIYVLDAGAVKRTIAYGSEKPRQEVAIVL
jgi:CRISPR-associated protein Cas2